jgi:hypothetical protein
MGRRRDSGFFFASSRNLCVTHLRFDGGRNTVLTAKTCLIAEPPLRPSYGPSPIFPFRKQFLSEPGCLSHTKGGQCREL